MAETHSSFRRQSHRAHSDKMGRMGVHRAAGGRLGDDAKDRKIAANAAKKAVHAHERHDHKGSPLTKLKTGGRVEGHAPRKNLGKHHRSSGGRLAPEAGHQEAEARADNHGTPPFKRASGGRTNKSGGKHGGKKGGKASHVNVNVISAPPHPPGGGINPAAALGAPPPRPPMAPPPAPPPGAGPPGGAMAGPPRPPMGPPPGGIPPGAGGGMPMMRAHGGRVEGGGGSGVGRLEKEREESGRSTAKEGRGETARFEGKADTAKTDDKSVGPTPEKQI